jgi:hypothetical protein
MHLPTGKPGQPAAAAAATPPNMGSASSQWSMSGRVEGAAQKPLGTPSPAASAQAPAIPASAKAGAPVTSAGGDE